MPLRDPYRLVEGPPIADSYMALRRHAGLTPRTPAQTAAALLGSWAAVHVVDGDGQAVGMGRVIGDGGWYFHVVDMAVIPEHQRRGLGDLVLGSLLDLIQATAPPNPYVTLLADPPGRRLYERHGFTQTAPDSVGMVLRSKR